MVDRGTLVRPWRKSSHSQEVTANCVEAARFTRGIGVRDSTDPDGPVLLFGEPEWAAFLNECRTRRSGASA
jgi:hypothetical protein